MAGRVDTTLQQGYLECRRQTRQHARTFFFASHVLPVEKRSAAYAVYAFCRRADNVVDHRTTGTPGADLVALRSDLDDVYGGGGTLEPASLALRDTVERYGIPREYFEDLLRGVEMDLSITRYATFAELEDYCYCVASVVGLMMSRVFGVSEPSALERALEMGTAMQLTNILRDVGEDYRMGRIYLPQSELEAFGYGEEDLAQGRVDQRFVRLMTFQIDRAREYYRRAAPGIEHIPDDGSRSCARLMSSTYAGILDRIEANGYDVFGRRAVVPLAGKLRIAAATLFHGGGSAVQRSRRPEDDNGPHSSGRGEHRIKAGGTTP